MSTLGIPFVRGAQFLGLLLAACTLRPTRAEVVSLTIGIDTRCPYGLVA